MRIALIVDPMIPVPPKLYGGVERIVHMLVQGLTERGHKVIMFGHEDSDVPCRLVPYSGKRAQHPLDTLRNALTVSRLVIDRPDIVHSFGRLAYLTPLLPLSIPKIMSYQRHVTTSRIRLAMTLARNGTMQFTGCSEHIANEIRPHAPATAIPNGVPPHLYDFVGDVGEHAPLVFLGRIAPIKGTHHAVAVAERTGRPLVIAGNVPDEHQSYFNETIRPHLDGEHIRYVGPVDDAEKNHLLGRAAAFLMPIEWDEPFGIVMAEAMACGTPVIGLNRGSVPEVVDHGRTGFVCRSVSDMVQAVHRLDTIDRADVYARFDDRYSDCAVVDAYEDLYVDFIPDSQSSRQVAT
jgi:glycosyltransferase involved in cell wall biosynthesis